jgi:hypothetical protein
LAAVAQKPGPEKPPGACREHSMITVVDSSGTEQKSYTYDVYGEPTVTGSLANEFPSGRLRQYHLHPPKRQRNFGLAR